MLTYVIDDFLLMLDKYFFDVVGDDLLYTFMFFYIPLPQLSYKLKNRNSDSSKMVLQNKRVFVVGVGMTKVITEILIYDSLTIH